MWPSRGAVLGWMVGLIGIGIVGPSLASCGRGTRKAAPRSSCQPVPTPSVLLPHRRWRSARASLSPPRYEASTAKQFRSAAPAWNRNRPPVQSRWRPAYCANVSRWNQAGSMASGPNEARPRLLPPWAGCRRLRCDVVRFYRRARLHHTSFPGPGRNDTAPDGAQRSLKLAATRRRAHPRIHWPPPLAPCDRGFPPPKVEWARGVAPVGVAGCKRSNLQQRSLTCLIGGGVGPLHSGSLSPRGLGGMSPHPPVRLPACGMAASLPLADPGMPWPTPQPPTLFVGTVGTPPPPRPASSSPFCRAPLVVVVVSRFLTFIAARHPAARHQLRFDAAQEQGYRPPTLCFPATLAAGVYQQKSTRRLLLLVCTRTTIRRSPSPRSRFTQQNHRHRP